MRYILMRLLEGDEKTNAGDTLLAVASQPCQLGCAATANKSLPPAKDNGAAGILPHFRHKRQLSSWLLQEPILGRMFLHLSFLKEGGTSIPAASAHIQSLCNQM